MPAVRTLPSLKARQPRVVPYEQVIALDINPARPPPTRPESMAHVVSQTQQPPQPPLPYSHPSYEHYPPPVYPYPPPPHHHQSHPHPQYPHQPPPYAQYPPNSYYPPRPPPQQPPPPANGTANPPPPAAGPPRHLQGQPPSAANGNFAQIAQQEGNPPATPIPRDKNTDDDDTKLVRCALRWIFVRIPGVSHTLFWNDVAESFNRLRRRPYATCKRRVEVLERTWRANFAARDAQGGLRGKNNTDLARAMRAWLAFRDEEEREKKEKEDDARALDVRRRRLHELETERLGLTDVCRYETRVVTEDEEIGPQGIELNERQPADGDNTNPIPIDDEPDQTELDPLEDLEPPKPIEQPNAADQIAPIVELLRKRQREEREEADIRREEQVLLNKRLAMMEEQVQMLSKLITHNNPPPTPPSPTVDAPTNNCAEVAVESDMEAETMALSKSTHDIIVVDDEPAEDVLRERTGAPLEPGTTTKSTRADKHAMDEAAHVASNACSDTSPERGASAGSEDGGVDQRISIEAADIPADVSMDDSAEPPGEPLAELGTSISMGTTEDQNDDAQATSQAAAAAAADSPAANAHHATDAGTGAADEDPAMEIPRTTDTTND